MLQVNLVKMVPLVKFHAAVVLMTVNSLVCPVLLVLRVPLVKLVKTVHEVSKVLMVLLAPQVETAIKL